MAKKTKGSKSKTLVLEVKKARKLSAEDLKKAMGGFLPIGSTKTGSTCFKPGPSTY